MGDWEIGRLKTERLGGLDSADHVASMLSRANARPGVTARLAKSARDLKTSILRSTQGARLTSLACNGPVAYGSGAFAQNLRCRKHAWSTSRRAAPPQEAALKD